jgi:hypothetical protein
LGAFFAPRRKKPGFPLQFLPFGAKIPLQSLALPKNGIHAILWLRFLFYKNLKIHSAGLHAGLRFGLAASMPFFGLGFCFTKT